MTREIVFGEDFSLQGFLTVAMKRLLLVLLVTALASGVVVGGEYYAFQETDLRFIQAHVSGLSTSGIEVTLVAEAENPTPIATTISEQYLEVYSNGSHVATVDRQSTILLPAEESRLLKYPTTLDVGGALRAFVEQFGSDRTTLRVQGQYTFASRWLGVDFEVPVGEERVRLSR